MPARCVGISHLQKSLPRPITWGSACTAAKLGKGDVRVGCDKGCPHSGGGTELCLRRRAGIKNLLLLFFLHSPPPPPTKQPVKLGIKLNKLVRNQPSTLSTHPTHPREQTWLHAA